LHFVIDFDGTISTEDVFCRLLDTYAPSTWRDAGKLHAAGHINGRECLSREISFLDASLDEIDACAATVPPDPHFAAFVVRAQALGATMEIVSDGLDRVILPYIERLGVDIPITCNRLRQAEERRWLLEFPPPPPEPCVGSSGVCKCRVLRPHRYTVLIGDGVSDFCIAGRVDFVLAKGELARHCREKGFLHLAIAGFADALQWLESQDHVARAKDGETAAE
jgi:2-hydroxy-3-keto-5-methylthiopentenyl-1-phosphate phosphatase